MESIERKLKFYYQLRSHYYNKITAISNTIEDLELDKYNLANEKKEKIKK